MSDAQPENFDSNRDAEFIEARLDSISVTHVGFILFLKGEEEKRVLPIFIGANEAQSIAQALNEQESPRPPRPMTHDLLKSMLEALDCALTRVEIHDIREGTFFGRVYLDKAGIEELEFDARPSDAIALALRWEAPLFMSRRVFEEAAVPVASGDNAEEGESAPGAEETPLSPAEKIRQDLQKALEEERYEEAARLRDELKRLQSGN